MERRMLTTGIFSRYVGAVLGLTVGYAVRYRLDRRFFFREPAP